MLRKMVADGALEADVPDKMLAAYNTWNTDMGYSSFNENTSRKKISALLNESIRLLNEESMISPA